MKSRFTPGLRWVWTRVILAAVGLTVNANPLFADPTGSVLIAAMKLSEKPNYSWTSSVRDDVRAYEIRGKTELGGYTEVAMPIPKDLVPRLGRTRTYLIDAVFRGNVDCVIAVGSEWLRKKDLPPDDALFEMASPTDPNRERRGEFDPFQRAPVLRKASRPPPDPLFEGGYSNLQLAICHPHEELGIIVSSHTELSVSAGVAIGTLTESGAMLLLVHDGQKHITPRQARGAFKLWIQNGAVAKYELQLWGELTVEGLYGPKDVEVNQTQTTTIKDVGTTRVSVPPEAKKKLGG